MRIGEQSFSSKDVEPQVGEIILETIEKNNKNNDEQIKTKVDLNSPDVEVFVYILPFRHIQYKARSSY